MGSVNWSSNEGHPASFYNKARVDIRAVYTPTHASRPFKNNSDSRQENSLSQNDDSSPFLDVLWADAVRDVIGCIATKTNQSSEHEQEIYFLTF